MKKVVAIIQARLQSTRLPGKVLMDLAETPTLKRIVDRIKKAKTVNEIIVLTTTHNRDIPIIRYCRDSLKVLSFRGTENGDVMTGMLKLCDQYPKKDLIIVDITGDCPLVDPRHIDKLVKAVKSRYDYASNIFPRMWPDGFDIQVYKEHLIRNAELFITNPVHRGHSGWNILNQIDNFYPRPRIFNLYPPKSCVKPDWGLTLDTEEDLTLLNTVFYYFKYNGNKFPSALQVINYLKKNPNLLEINKNVKRKEPGNG